MEHPGLRGVEEWPDEAVEIYWLERARGVDEGDWRDVPQQRAWLLCDFAMIDQELERRMAIQALF